VAESDKLAHASQWRIHVREGLVPCTTTAPSGKWRAVY
jgi:hypothetical protein